MKGKVDQLLIINDGVAEYKQVVKATSTSLSVHGGEWPLEGLRPVHNKNTGGTLYLVAADIPAQIAAQRVAAQHKSAREALQELFTGSKGDSSTGGLNWQTLIIIVALIVAVILK